MEVLCRRRKNNPVFVGEAGVGKTALAEGLAQRLLQDDVPAILKGAEVFSLDTTALLAGTRFRGDFEERFKAVVAALAKRRQADPLHRRSALHRRRRRHHRRHDGPGHADQAGADRRRAARRRLDHVRGVQADREGPRRWRAGCRRSSSTSRRSRRPCGSSRACARATRQHHNVRYTDARARRRRQAGRRGTCAIRGCPTAPSTSSTKPAPCCACSRKRRPPPAEGVRRRGRRRQPTAGEPARHGRGAAAARSTSTRSSASSRASPASRRSRRRRPTRNASRASRTRSTASCSARPTPCSMVATSIKRARAGLGQPDKPAGCFLFTGPDRRRQDRARQAARAAPRQRVHALRHVASTWRSTPSRA